MNEETRLALIAAGTALGLVGLKSAIGRRAQKRELQRIELWKRERLNCIRAAEERAIEALRDPNHSIEEAMTAFNEDMKFIDIICRLQ